MNKFRVTNGIKGLWEIKVNNINTVTIMKWKCPVVYTVEQLGTSGARHSHTTIFSVHPVGKKLCVGSKNDWTFLMVSTSSITMQSLEKIVLRALNIGVIF